MIWALLAFPVSADDKPGNAKCDDNLALIAGKGPGPFFGLDMVLGAWALAERYCGAAPVDMAVAVHNHAIRQGCGKETPAYQALDRVVGFLREASDEELLGIRGSGNPAARLQAEVDASVKEFGGGRLDGEMTSSGSGARIRAGGLAWASSALAPSAILKIAASASSRTSFTSSDPASPAWYAS